MCSDYLPVKTALMSIEIKNKTLQSQRHFDQLLKEKHSWSLFFFRLPLKVLVFDWANDPIHDQSVIKMNSFKRCIRTSLPHPVVIASVGKGLSSGDKAMLSQSKPTCVTAAVQVKPFAGKVFYLDLPSNRIADILESDIGYLGGVRENVVLCSEWFECFVICPVPAWHRQVVTGLFTASNVIFSHSVLLPLLGFSPRQLLPLHLMESDFFVW